MNKTKSQLKAHAGTNKKKSKAASMPSSNQTDKTSPLPKSKSSALEDIRPLSPKEKSVLEFIEFYLAEKGFSPSYAEIQEHFGLASVNSVQNYLKQMIAKGYLALAPNQKRAIQVLKSASAVQEVVTQRLSSVSHLNSAQRGPAPAGFKSVSTTGSSRAPLLQAREEILSLPLLGKVAAGQPIEAFSHDEFIDVPPSMVKNSDKTYALKVQGSSMIDDGIFDGDIILVQKQNHASNSDIVVASVENEATVKRFYLRPHPETAERKVELRPANSSMKSMWFDPHDVNIQGILVGLIRKF